VIISVHWLPVVWTHRSRHVNPTHRCEWVPHSCCPSCNDRSWVMIHLNRFSQEQEDRRIKWSVQCHRDQTTR